MDDANPEGLIRLGLLISGGFFRLWLVGVFLDLNPESLLHYGLRCRVVGPSM